MYYSAGISRDDRECKCCSSNMIEDEYHFMLCCTLHNRLRSSYLGKTSWPSTNMLKSVLSTNSRRKLLNVSKYTKAAMKLRDSTLET